MKKLANPVYYNQDIKERFISEQKETLRNNYIFLFKSTKEFEEKANKDLYLFNREDIEKYYSFLNKSSVKGLMVVHNGIRRYMRWAYNKRLCENYESWMEDITQGSLSYYCNRVMLKSKRFDREVLLNWIDRLKNDFGFYNPRDTFMVLATFEGMANFEFLDVKWSDIIKEKNKYYVQLSKRKIEISKELYEIAKQAAFSSYYYALHKTGGIRKFDLEESDLVVRPIKSNNSKGFSHVNVSVIIKKLMSKVDCEFITLKDIELNGKLYMVQEKMKEHNMTMMNYCWSQYFIDEVCYQFGMITSTTNNIRNHITNFKVLLGLT